MPTSRTSSEATARAPRVRPIEATSARRFVAGGSPLLTLRRSGEGKVHLPLEAFQPTGSFYDRVAERQLDTLPERCATIVVYGFTAHSLAVARAVRVRRLETRVRVIARDDESPRLRPLIAMVADEVLPAGASPELTERDVVLRRRDPSAVRAAVRQVLEEIGRGVRPPVRRIVLPDFGAPRAELERDVRDIIGEQAELVFVADDEERPRALDGSISCRRAQIGHREGLLLGPLGAEVAEIAIESALTDGGHTAAVIPDGGHRYLGWW